MLQALYQSILQLWPTLCYIFGGIGSTLSYSLTAVFFGLSLGTLLAIAKICHNVVLRYLANFYTSIFRGTPLLIQLSIIYFGIPSIFDLRISVFLGGVIAFSLNSAAYVSEIVRSGINSIDKGQFEAAIALNVPVKYIYKDIIAPQAIGNILPSLVNELINLVKESAIISILGETDLMYRAQLVSAESYSYFLPLCIAGGYYYCIILFLTYLAKLLERKLAS